MFKRIISIFLALCLTVSCFCVPASAVNPVGMINDISRFYSDIWEISEQYDKGEISQSEFFEKFASSMVRFDINYGSDITSFKDVLNVFEFCGVDVPDKWQEWFYENKMGGGGSGGNRDDSILNGCSCAAFQYDSKGQKYLAMYGFNGTLKEYKAGVFTANMYFDVYYTYNPSTGAITSTLHNGSKNFDYNTNLNPRDWVLYGSWDVTTLDDEAVPDGVITELPEKKIPNYDDDSVDENDLIDFLKDLLQELMLQFPDLSTVEGLLRAILAKCTSIESRMDEQGGGMNPDELQVMLDKAILSLTVQNKVNNDALLNELVAIREAIQGYGDEEIPPEEADSILQGLISGITSGLLSFVGIDLDVSEIVDICEEAGDLGISVLRGIVDIIAILNASVPLQAVNALITTLTGIIFNLNEPTDLTFTLNGAEVTFLSADLLSVPQIAAALNIIKGFVSILVAYAWLKWARKFYLSQF